MTHLSLHRARYTGLLAGLIGGIVYVLTTEPSLSWWDCGEFLATSRYLQVGHPPGAPLYSLLEHLFMLLAGGDTTRMAYCGNLLSAVAGGATGAFLCWTIIRLAERLRLSRHGGAESDAPASFSSLLAGATGTLIYVFCDTAWFNAVESEVYSLSMLFSAVIFWAGLRWYDSRDERQSPRWLLLIALLLGLSYCVHQLSLLTLPALLLMYVLKRRRTGWHKARLWPTLPLAALLFMLGTTPLLLIPIRAQANPPINEGDPATWPAFRAYMQREQYSHAPLYPRIWRADSEHDRAAYSTWCDDPQQPTLMENMRYFAGYQLGYMYLRYLMWNFSGRYNDRQGFLSLQNGQFVTGIPPLDRALVGTAAPLPDSMAQAGHNVYYMLPLLLAVLGLFFHLRSRQDDGWVVATLFLTSGLLLSLYLNHPAYEPRERDYAYVLSFYAFAMWAGLGAQAVALWLRQRLPGRWYRLSVLLLAVPLLMAMQNLDDHDRSRRYIPRDVAYNYLNECGDNAILLTYGDNDTFPFWYLQQVEEVRSDVQVINLNLFATPWYQQQMAAQLAQQGTPLLPLQHDEQRHILDLLNLLVQRAPEAGRPIHLSHYVYDRYGALFAGHTACVGFGYAVSPTPCDSIDCTAFCRNVMAGRWHSLENVYIDEVSQRMLATYWRHVLSLADRLVEQNEPEQARRVLDKTCADIPTRYLDDLRIAHRAATLYGTIGATAPAQQLTLQVQHALRDRLAYYNTLSPQSQSYIPYTLHPLHELQDEIER